MELKSRSEVPVELTWDLSSIYKTEEEMYQDVEKLKLLKLFQVYSSIETLYF